MGTLIRNFANISIPDINRCSTLEIKLFVWFEISGPPTKPRHLILPTFCGRWNLRQTQVWNIKSRGNMGILIRSNLATSCHVFIIADKFVIWSFNKSLTYSLNDLRYWGFALCSINSRQITFTPVGEDGYVLIRENPTFCLESLPWGWVGREGNWWTNFKKWNDIHFLQYWRSKLVSMQRKPRTAEMEVYWDRSGVVKGTDSFCESIIANNCSNPSFKLTNSIKTKS